MRTVEQVIKRSVVKLDVGDILRYKGDSGAKIYAIFKIYNDGYRVVNLVNGINDCCDWDEDKFLDEEGNLQKQWQFIGHVDELKLNVYPL